MTKKNCWYVFKILSFWKISILINLLNIFGEIIICYDVEKAIKRLKDNKSILKDSRSSHHTLHICLISFSIICRSVIKICKSYLMQKRILTSLCDIHYSFTTANDFAGLKTTTKILVFACL